MPGLVNYAALILDLRGALRERQSWGRVQILDLIEDLEQRHRINESADAATLRRFGDHLAETVLDLLPAPSATADPLVADDPSGTSAAMDDGADHRSHKTEASCPLVPTYPKTPSPPTQDSRRAAPRPRSLAAATR